MDLDIANSPFDLKMPITMLTPWINKVFWKRWESDGRKLFIERCTQSISLFLSDSQKHSVNVNIFSKAMIELFRALKRNIVPSNQVEELIQEFININPTKIIPLICDALAMILAIAKKPEKKETAPESTEDEVLDENEVFYEIMRNCKSLHYCLIEAIHNDYIKASGILSIKEKDYNTKFIRLKSRLYYLQRKFNLMREESLGYSMLFQNIFKSDFVSTPLVEIKTMVQYFIGHFSLDPNRVIDFILEAFELKPEKDDFFVSLLKLMEFEPDNVCQILSYKIDWEDTNSLKPLFNLVAIFINKRFFSLSMIYNYMKPFDKDFINSWKLEKNSAREFLKKALVVSLNPNPAEEQHDSFTEDKTSLNPKLLLIETLLSFGDWKNSQIIFERLPDYSCVSNKRIAIKLANMIHYLIEPLYEKCILSNFQHFGKKREYFTNKKFSNMKQVKTFSELKDNLDPLFILGPYIYNDFSLSLKFIQLIKFYFKNGNEINKNNSNGENDKSEKRPKLANKDEIYYAFVSVLDQVILPSVSFGGNNVSLNNDLWSCLAYLPYNHRYILYNSWKSEEKLLRIPSLIKLGVTAIKTTKHIMRRLSNENIKQISSTISRLAHSWPIFMFEYILSQIQLYDNLIPPVLEAFNNLSPLSYDILGYCILETFSSCEAKKDTSYIDMLLLLPNRPKTKHDGTTISSWLQNLSSFTGSVCNNFSIELIPFLQFVTNQLKNNVSLDLLLLKEIVLKMAKISSVEIDNLNSDKLLIMAGGKYLLSQNGFFGELNTREKNASKLRSALSNDSLALSLSLLIAQQREFISNSMSNVNMNIKLVGKLYDEVQDTFLMFVNFVIHDIHFEKHLPSLKELMETFHLSPDLAFFLWRTILFKQILDEFDKKLNDTKGKKLHNDNTTQQLFFNAYDKIINPVISQVETTLISNIQDVSAAFYVTFWTLSLYDIYVPIEPYYSEIGKSNDKRITSKLEHEKNQHREHVKWIHNKLSSEKENWFLTKSGKSLTVNLLQYFIYPRCIFSSLDAVYCAHFIFLIRSFKAPHFPMLHVLDRIFCDNLFFRNLLVSFTENEANRYGRFLATILEFIMRWHRSKKEFNDNCVGYPDFLVKVSGQSQRQTSPENKDKENNNYLDYENYRHFCYKLQKHLTGFGRFFFSTEDFILRKNALLVFIKILPFFPMIKAHAEFIIKMLSIVRVDEKEKHKDLHLLTTSYLGLLKQRLPIIMDECDFHNLQMENNKNKSSSLSESKMSKDKKSRSRESSQTTHSSEPKIKKIKQSLIIQ